MSVEYAKYLDQHTANVYRGYEWFQDNLPEILSNVDYTTQIKYHHDLSKFDPEEYEPYDEYFYGKGKGDPATKLNFRYAWLHHIHNNPHHWQYWVLINDNPGEGLVCLDMPYNYVVEMICDWWSFSWKTGKLTEIFSWYDEHKDYMKLSGRTRKTVEDILEKIKTKLEEPDGDESNN